jgi:hypothetical protein
MWKESFRGPPPAESSVSCVGVQIEAATEGREGLSGRPRESHLVERVTPRGSSGMKGQPAPRRPRSPGSVLSGRGAIRLTRSGTLSPPTPTIEVDQFNFCRSESRTRRKSSRDDVSHGDWRGHRPAPARTRSGSSRNPEEPAVGTAAGCHSRRGPVSCIVAVAVRPLAVRSLSSETRRFQKVGSTPLRRGTDCPRGRSVELLHECRHPTTRSNQWLRRDRRRVSDSIAHWLATVVASVRRSAYPGLGAMTPSARLHDDRTRQGRRYRQERVAP